jgi:hypothetical protein
MSILLGVEEGFAVTLQIVEPLPKQIDQRIGHRLLADGIAARESHAPEANRLRTPRSEAAIAQPRHTPGLRIDRIEISEHNLDRGAEAVNV